MLDGSISPAVGCISVDGGQMSRKHEVVYDTFNLESIDFLLQCFKVIIPLPPPPLYV